MAGVFWMLMVVFCSLVLSESGDDDWSDIEPAQPDVTCTSNLTLIQSNLTCSLNDEPTEEIKCVKLCKTECKDVKENCTDAIPGQPDFTFKDLTIAAKYVLCIGDNGFEKYIDLTKIVKIPAPEIKLASYKEDTEDVFIWFEHRHDYVLNPKFQVEIWRDKRADKPLCLNMEYRNVSVSKERLGGDGFYYTRIRAKPTGFFDGNWSEWSSNVSFTIKSSSFTKTEKNFDLPKVSYIMTFFVILMLIIAFGTLRWRTQIKDYITPNIPHPKATLAQMHRGLPFTFSPEIFSDVFIHRVDYVDEKPCAPEPQDDLDEHRYSQASSSRASVSEMDMKADECLPKEQSHLKIRLLDNSDLSKDSENGTSQSITSPQRECKDEAYVTMSSLFKTQ